MGLDIYGRIIKKSLLDKYSYKSTDDVESIRKILNEDGKEIFINTMIDEIVKLTTSDNYTKDFLEFINQNYNICTYVCGKDYRFGKGGLGDVEFLTEYALKNGQTVFVQEDCIMDDKKVSTTLIKELLSNGEIEKANALLKTPYSYSSVVMDGRKVGSKLGFPTINLKVDGEKQRLKNGVYFGHVTIDNKEYKTVINYGNRPTYGLDEVLIEAHVIDFDGNLYGRNIRVEFLEFIRPEQKFASVEELTAQVLKDIEKAKEI
jgi:riboflavin kinase/FMN adenylyltransferase